MRTLKTQQNVGLFEWLVGLIVVALFAAMFVSAANAQEDLVVQCEPTLEGYVATNLVVRYTNGDINLVALSGETYRTIDHNVNLQSTFRYQWWSSDCRYFASTIDEGSGFSLVVWDTHAGERIGTFAGLVGDPVLALYWSPDGQYVLINSQHRSELWNPREGTRAALGEGAGSTDINADMIYWDMARGELWRLRHYNYSSSDAGVTVYNFAGTTIAYYGNPAGADRETGFRLSDDGRYVLVYTVTSTGLRGAGVTVWQRDTGENVQVDADTDGAMSPYCITLSPDGRYLVVAHNLLRVWDLHNLPDDVEERDPIARYPIIRPLAVSFVDNSTVRVDGRDGMTDSVNVETGEYFE